jgi:hypothetical protein
MASYPNRCQHIKVNGTQCGSPALRRNKFCFFHKEWREQRVQLHANRARRTRSICLPVLEDANSIQVALMQVMRLIVSKDIDSKTAGLLLYALQTASVNLRNTRFEPRSMHEVVLNPNDVADTPLGTAQLWTDEDFEGEDEEEIEEDGEEQDEEEEEEEEGEEEEGEEEEENGEEEPEPGAEAAKSARKPPRTALPRWRVLNAAGEPENMTPLERSLVANGIPMKTIWEARRG